MHLVTTEHGWVTYTRRTPLYYGIDRRCLVRYERVICVSNDLQKICLGIGVPLQRCVTVENAIDTEQYSRRHSIDEAKRSLNLPVDRPLIGAVGRLSDEKGFDVLIRAVARLLKQGENVGLSILGDGIARPRLQALIDALGVADRVSLVGYCSNPIRWYHAMDIYALSSIREGLPNALLEAMALEVPVVATRVAGVPRLIEDGKTGLLVEPNSVDDLVQALQRVLHDAELRASLRSAGRNIIIQRHDFRDRMEKVCRVYHEVLREAPLVRRSVQQP
jgi:glycosyltransferase involved in cell wall biosynthesis